MAPLIAPLRLVACVACLAWAGTARADLYRCELADGRVIFTDDASKCPGAEPHVPRGAVQTVETRPALRVPAAAPAAPNAAGLEAPAQGEEARWRALVRRKRDELARTTEGREALQEYVSHCNRGGDLFSRDEAGLEQGVSCDSVREEYARLEAAEREIREYLEHELEDECRRAGCLPGWIR